MKLSTLKRNWMLHYIKPEYLYLPRKSEEEQESCTISFTYKIYKRLNAYDEPIDTKINSLQGYLFKDNILIKDSLGNNRGSTFIINKKGDYYFIPYIQYRGSFIPENRKFKISITNIRDATIFVYGIDMARTHLYFQSEVGGTETIQQLRSFIGINFRIDVQDEQEYYYWNSIRMADLLMLKCNEGEAVIPQRNKKNFIVGGDDKHFIVNESPGEHYDVYYGDWHLNWQYQYSEYTNINLTNGTDILCKTFNSDFNYSANYFHYVEYHYSDMYKSNNPPVYPIPLSGGSSGKHYLSTTFCCFEGDGIPPDPETGPSPTDPLSEQIWYNSLYCDQHLCYIPKIGGKFSLSETIKEEGYNYKLHEIGISVIGTDQYISTNQPVRQGKGPYSLLFSFILEKDDPFDENPPEYLDPLTSGICRLNIDEDFERSALVKWLTYNGMEPVVNTNDFEGYTRMLRVDGRIMYDPLIDNYGKNRPDENYKRRGRHNREDIVKGNISDHLWDNRISAGEVETIIPFIFYNPRDFDYNNFLRYESSNPVALPYENVHLDDGGNPRLMVFFHTACNHDYMSLSYVYEVEQAENILLNGEERILGEEYRAEGGVFVNGECIIYP